MKPWKMNGESRDGVEEDMLLRLTIENLRPSSDVECTNVHDSGSKTVRRLNQLRSTNLNYLHNYGKISRYKRACHEELGAIPRPVAELQPSE